MEMDALLPDAQPQTNPGKREMVVATCGLFAVGALGTAIPFIGSMTPSDRARASGAPVEVDISGLRSGEMRVVEWRGKPVWILGRDAPMLSSLSGHNAELVDPISKIEQQPPYANNPNRSVRPEVFVAVGVCTHLGCSPVRADAGAQGSAELGENWQGGFFCPCHGSTFDFAGRVFKNKPAPSNLEVPPHRYLSETVIMIGEDPVA